MIDGETLEPIIRIVIGRTTLQELSVIQDAARRFVADIGRGVDLEFSYMYESRVQHICLLNFEGIQ